MSNITVSPMPSYVDAKEGERVEFKSSLFFSPVGGKERQVETIARELAAFMNSTGGDLFIGVRDDGSIKGIAEDLNALAKASEDTIVNGAHLYDRERSVSYMKATEDQYALKINAIVEAYLGKSAQDYIFDPEFKTDSGLTYVVLHIHPAPKEVVVLFQSVYYDKFRERHLARTELWVRNGGKKNIRKDRDRDDFVVNRALSTMNGWHESILKTLEEQNGALLQQITSVFYSVFQKTPPSQKTSDVVDQKAVKDGEQPKIDDRKCAEEVMGAMRTENVLMEEAKEVAQNSDLELLVDATTSSTYVMDKFDASDGNHELYSRLLLGRSSSIVLRPYEYDYKSSEGRYCKISDVDFQIKDVQLIIKRLPNSADLQGVPGVSFTDFKKGYTGNLCRYLFLQDLEDVKNASDGQLCEVPLHELFVFRAHTSKSIMERAINNPISYRVVGVKFVKQHLYFCPDSVSCDDYEKFGLLNFLAKTIKERRTLDTADSL